jgi:hypothetical protein
MMPVRWAAMAREGVRVAGAQASAGRGENSGRDRGAVDSARCSSRDSEAGGLPAIPRASAGDSGRARRHGSIAVEADFRLCGRADDCLAGRPGFAAVAFVEGTRASSASWAGVLARASLAPGRDASRHLVWVAGRTMDSDDDDSAGAGAAAGNADAALAKVRPPQGNWRRNDGDGCGRAAIYSLLGQYSHGRGRMSRDEPERPRLIDIRQLDGPWPQGEHLDMCAPRWPKSTEPVIVAMSVSEAKQNLKEGHPPDHHTTLIISAHKLLDCCDDPEVTIEDMLRCLNYGGTIATVGARCLYVRTGRDGLGWDVGGNAFVVDRADWESYLREQGISL